MQYTWRYGFSKEKIKEYIEREFHYNLNRTLDEIRPGYHMMKVVREQYQRQLLHFWNPKILRTQYVMQYHLVEIRIHLVLLQEVLQKHFM